MYHGTIASPELMVLNNELIYMVKRFMRGFLVSKETLSVELIDEIGPSKHYLQHPATQRDFKEVFYSKLFDRSMVFNPDAPDFNARLRSMTLSAMAQEVEPLPSGVLDELGRLAAAWPVKS